MKSARSEGGKARAAKLSKRRRKEIARNAANARWGNRPAADPEGTTCKAEETGDGKTVACAPCGLSWAMDDTNYPRCPHIADLKAMPPIAGGLEEHALSIAHALLHGGQRADFDTMLANRPDWQAHVQFITAHLVQACSEVA